MKKTTLISLLTIVQLVAFGQKKYWVTLDGTPTKKENAEAYYTLEKTSEPNSVKATIFLIDKKTPFETANYKTKKEVIKNGKYSLFNENGTLLKEIFYSNGKKYGSYYTFDAAKGSVRGYYVAGVKNFIWIKKAIDKSITENINYKSGVLNGPYYAKTKEGFTNGFYRNGKKEGRFDYYTPNKKFIQSVVFENDVALPEFEKKSVEKKSVKNNAAEDANYEDVHQITEQAPEFPGGTSAMMSFIARNTRYPMSAREFGIQGRVFVKFIIEKDGSISGVKSSAPLGKEVSGVLLEEAIRVVKSMPNWTPGMQLGKAVRCNYTIPVNFRVR